MSLMASDHCSFVECMMNWAIWVLVVGSKGGVGGVLEECSRGVEGK